MAVSRPDDFTDGTAESAPASLHAAEAPTENLFAGPIGDQCANCGAGMAGDQRYCLNCGERRGRSRFAAGSAPMPGGAVTTTTVTTTAPPARRSSAGMTLIAGIATLILAMGVGVLIGQNNTSSSTQTRAAAPQVIVNGGGGSGSTGSSASAGNTNASGSGKHVKTVKVLKTEKAKAANAAKASKPTAAAVQKAGNAAAKVTGGSNTQKPTVQSGQACAAGSPGCTNGKFTGTFFGQ